MTIKTIQKLINKLSIKINFCIPMFFRGDEPDLEKQIQEKKEHLLAACVSKKEIDNMPIFLEGCLADD
ncbi:MAG: hypothetical protein FWB86_05270 [Treponema sp.]|nr:hypothetical protein [Treponema sp.]